MSPEANDRQYHHRMIAASGFQTDLMSADSAFRCVENGAATGARVLRHRRHGAVGRRAAAAREDPAEDPARRRAPDRVSRGHRRPLLRRPLGEEPVAVEAGEVIVFTNGDPHVMSSAPGMRADPATHRARSTAMPGSQLPFFINFGGDGPPRPSSCAAFSPAMRSPSIRCSTICRRSSRPATAQGSDHGWLGQFIRVAMAEVADKRAGGESVLAKLSELMFIEVVRRHLETLPPEQAGLARRPARSVSSARRCR